MSTEEDIATKMDSEEVAANEQALRVKRISEINGNAEACQDKNQTGAAKRKLPAWMLAENNEVEDNGASSSSTSSCKRNKTNTNNEGNEQIDSIDGNFDAVIARLDEADAETESSNLAVQSDIVENEVKIKTEPIDRSEAADDGQPSTSRPQQTTDDSAVVKTEVLSTTPESTVVGSAGPIKPAVKVEKADATSTTGMRPSCKFGIRCYRRNPMHRMEEAHPGDNDYRRPKFPTPPKGTPDCPFGNACYRRNPIHFQQYKHPEDTDFEQNYKDHRMRLRQRRQRQQQQNIDSVDEDYDGSDLDDYDLDDPFIDDEDSEYMPSNDEDDDDEDELDFDFRRNAANDNDDDDDDDLDKAEE